MADWVALWGSLNAVFLWHIFALMGWSLQSAQLNQLMS